MPLFPPNVDYSDRDFDAIRARLIALVRSVFPDWTDFEVASFGNVLLEMFAFVGDVLGYYIDAHARESRLVTATQRKNVIALARMLGYRLPGAHAATAELVFRLSEPAQADVRVPAGTLVRTREVTEPIRFQLLGDVLIPAGAIEARGVVEHSATHTQLVDVRGLPDLDLVLDRTPYLDGSARVAASNGAYEERENLLSSGAHDRHFTVIVDESDRATLRFGNGRTGAPPTGTVEIQYKTGGGVVGNVEAGSLRVLEAAVQDAHGRPVQLEVLQPERASGGIERQSVAAAKVLVPESLKTLTRSVTREDFEVNARRVPGVARALMVTSNEALTVQENAGILFVVPQGGGLPTPALKDAVRRMVTETYPPPLTFEVSVQDPIYKPIDVEARIHVRPGHAKGEVRDRIRAVLTALFQVSGPRGEPNRDIDFGLYLGDGAGGGELAWSDVFNAVRDVPGVRKLADGPTGLLLNGEPRDVFVPAREFPTLRQVVLVDSETGAFL